MIWQVYVVAGIVDRSLGSGPRWLRRGERTCLDWRILASAAAKDWRLGPGVIAVTGRPNPADPTTIVVLRRNDVKRYDTVAA